MTGSRDEDVTDDAPDPNRTVIRPGRSAASWTRDAGSEGDTGAADPSPEPAAPPGEEPAEESAAPQTTDDASPDEAHDDNPDKADEARDKANEAPDDKTRVMTDNPFAEPAKAAGGPEGSEDAADADGADIWDAPQPEQPESAPWPADQEQPGEPEETAPEIAASSATDTAAAPMETPATAAPSPDEPEPDLAAPDASDAGLADARAVDDATEDATPAEQVAAPEAAEDAGPAEPDSDAGDAVSEAARIEMPVQQQYASLLAALSARIEHHPGGHDLLAVLRMLEGQTAPGGSSSGMDPQDAGEPAPPRIGKSRRLMEDIVRFGQDPSSEFAPSTIERATRDRDGGLVLLERFLGLLGPHGALPAAYTDEAIMRGLRGDDSFPRFLDVFNNRFVQLFYRAWADARPIVQHDRPDDDRFLAYLGATIGTGAPIFRDLDRIDDRLKLLYAGLTAPKTKSAARLKALITGVFGIRVEIDQCVGTWLHLDKDDQLKLGGLGSGGAGALGADTIVGAKVYSVSDKIRIRIFTRSLEEYRKFLPPTRTRPNPWTEKLFDLIDFYLGLEVEYEIELALPRRCASAVRMDSSSSATLGHIGWLKPAAEAPPADDDDLEEEDMLTDTRFRPVRRHTTVYQ